MSWNLVAKIEDSEKEWAAAFENPEYEGIQLWIVNTEGKLLRTLADLGIRKKFSDPELKYGGFMTLGTEALKTSFYTTAVAIPLWARKASAPKIMNLNQPKPPAARAWVDTTVEWPAPMRWSGSNVSA